VDALQSKKLCGKTLGVYGTSMGASIAILFAAADPRVETVIAVAPFADIREEVPSFGRNVFGRFGDLFSDSILNSIANTIGDISHMDLDDAKPIDAITKIKIPILLIHGDEDTIIPHIASEKLHAAAPDHTQLVTIPGVGHLELCFDPAGKLQDMTHLWFDKHLMHR
jgi:pimeloyl-ACP methyl ester carboxylesterase